MFEALLAGTPRLTRANYGPRAISFAAAFVIIAILARERGWALWHLAFPALYLLIYPHLLVVVSRHFSVTTRFEIRATLADSLVLGFMAAWIDFYQWLSFAFLVAVALNAAVIGGRRQLLLSLALFAAGAFAGGALNGWQLRTPGPFYIEVLAMILLLAYVLVVGFVAFDQNARLVKASRAIAERNRVFRALVEISSSAEPGGDVQEFLHEALERIHDLYPQYGLGMVIRDVQRPEVMRFAGFKGIPAEEQNAVVHYLAAARAPDSRELTWTEPDRGTIFQMVFDHTPVRVGEGVIVVRANAISSLLREAARLSLGMLGVLVENKLLALDLKYAAERDPLTGAYNRGYLDSELASAIRSRKQYSAMEFSVLMIDLIGLKPVNDKFGHAAGDMIIRETAGALQEVCRATDVFGRYGGDEFVILCPGSNREVAEQLRQRLKREVSGRKLQLATVEQGPAEVSLELSIGLASSSEVEPDRVLAAADAAMYRDKAEWYATHERYR